MRALRLRYRLALFASVPAVFLPVGLLASAAPARATVPAPPSGFTLTWSDDFNGGSRHRRACASWKYDTGQGVFGTGEIETMTTSTSNVY